MKTGNLLIIGKVPPPIGGVTIHVKRLLDKIKVFNYSHTFKPLNGRDLLKNLILMRRYRKCHLHTSSVYAQFLFSLVCMFFKTKSIITFHGDLKRYNWFKTQVVMLTVKITDYPIVLNQKSMIIAEKINKNAKLISAFIPPNNDEKLPNDLIVSLNYLKSKTKKVFGTNAHDVAFDKENNEIYGISDLVTFFNLHTDYGLVVSDPKGNYLRYIKEKGIPINNNILFIDFRHSFFEVLKYIDGSIRNTSTDGDSLSVKESLFLNKLTFVTDVVSRPDGVIKFKRGNYSVFLEEYNNPQFNVSDFDGSEKLIQLYKAI